MFWPFTVWTNCFSDLKMFANSWPSASNFKKKSKSLEYFFSNLNSNCSNVLDLRNLKEQVKKAFCFKHCTDLSLFKQIVLVISKILQILGLQPWLSKVFLISRIFFSHSRSEQFWKQNTITLFLRRSVASLQHSLHNLLKRQQQWLDFLHFCSCRHTFSKLANL